MYEKMIGPLEKKFENKIKKILIAQGEAIAQAYLKYVKENKDNEDITEEEAEKKVEEISDKIFKEDEGVQTTLAALLPFYIEAGKLGAEFFENIHVTNQEGTIYNIIRDNYMNWLNTYGCERIVMVSRTTKEITRRIIKKGLLVGDSTDKIANTLSSLIEDYSKHRALRIANTEMHNTFMRANMFSANASGFKYKKWITCRDNAVRSTHQPLDGKVVGINEDFKPGLGYPGDPRADKRETIRCRCIMRYLMEKEE